MDWYTYYLITESYTLHDIYGLETNSMKHNKIDMQPECEIIGREVISVPGRDLIVVDTRKYQLPITFKPGNTILDNSDFMRYCEKICQKVVENSFNVK
jgi:hypothetical protein